MTDREKLSELLKKAKAKEQYDFLFGDIDTAIDMPHGAEYYADFLIANGVTVNGEKYKEIDKFIESRVLDGKEYPTAKLYYEDYQKELERLYNVVTVQQWIPVSERLPEKDGRYLVVKISFNNTFWPEVASFAKDGRKVDKYDFHRGWKNVWYYYDSEWGHITIGDVTHWMPLPEPPKGE